MILFRTKQSIEESLKDYLMRFTEEMSTLEECDSHTASLTFREGVITGTKMHRSLVKTPLVDMREAMARADRIIRLEEEELTSQNAPRQPLRSQSLHRNKNHRQSDIFQDKKLVLDINKTNPSPNSW